METRPITSRQNGICGVKPLVQPKEYHTKWIILQWETFVVVEQLYTWKQIKRQRNISLGKHHCRFQPAKKLNKKLLNRELRPKNKQRETHQCYLNHTGREYKPQVSLVNNISSKMKAMQSTIDIFPLKAPKITEQITAQGQPKWFTTTKLKKVFFHRYFPAYEAFSNFV